MPNPQNLKGKGFESRPDDINRVGRVPGTQNRNTIARKVLAMEITVPDDLYSHFKVMYPKLPKTMTIEMIATLSVMKKAIDDGEYLHYKAIMDSGYGAPKQEIEHSGEVEIGFDIGKISNEDLQTILNITQKSQSAE